MTSSNTSSLHDFPDPDRQTVNLLLAPDLIGNFIGWFLYGLLVLQIYRYRQDQRQRSPSDPAGIKATVWGIFILESALTVITSDVTFTLLCTGWGNPNALVRLRRVDAFIPVVGGLVSGWTQTFYAWRIHVVSEHVPPWNWMSALIILLMATSSGLAFFCGFRTINFTDVTALMDIKPMLVAWLSASVLCDTLIATSMTYILYRHLARRRQMTSKIGREVVETRESLEARIQWIMLVRDMSAHDDSGRRPAYTLRCYTPEQAAYDDELYHLQALLEQPPCLSQLEGARTGTERSKYTPVADAGFRPNQQGEYHGIIVLSRHSVRQQCVSGKEWDEINSDLIGDPWGRVPSYVSDTDGVY